MTPEPVPPSWPALTLIVTTDGPAFFAIAVTALTSPVSLIVMVCGEPELVVAPLEPLWFMSTDTPAADPPPTSAPATSAMTTGTARERFLSFVAVAVAGVPAPAGAALPAGVGAGPAGAPGAPGWAEPGVVEIGGPDGAGCDPASGAVGYWAVGW